MAEYADFNLASQLLPISIDGTEGWKQMTVSKYSVSPFACGLVSFPDKNGTTAYCWGYDEYGKLGSDGGSIMTPRAVGPWPRASSSSWRAAVHLPLVLVIVLLTSTILL